jgi:DNA-binding MurR/RpiR family transcriptional regulator
VAPEVLPKLSLVASKVLLAIDLFGNLPNAQLAREAGVSRPSVIKAKRELKRLGIF